MERTVRNYVIPWISKSFELKGKRVLEVGCGEGGNLGPFLGLGCTVVGLDNSPTRIERTQSIFSSHEHSDRVTFHTHDATRFDLSSLGKFDLIILKDFIEHVDQRPFLEKLKPCLKKNGVVFIGFPPWQMPFGGHQQVCKSKLGRLPWIHLLPLPIYLGWLKLIGEPESRIHNLKETRQTGISIEELKRLLTETGYSLLSEQLYLINPGYEAKFNLKPRKKLPLIGDIPYLKNYVNTCSYLLVSSTD